MLPRKIGFIIKIKNIKRHEIFCKTKKSGYSEKKIGKGWAVEKKTKFFTQQKYKNRWPTRFSSIEEEKFKRKRERLRYCVAVEKYDNCRSATAVLSKRFDFCIKKKRA